MAATVIYRSFFPRKNPVCFIINPILSIPLRTTTSPATPLLKIPPPIPPSFKENTPNFSSTAAITSSRLISYITLQSKPPIQRRFFSSESNTNSTISFPYSDSESESDEEVSNNNKKKNAIDEKMMTSKLPPPYDPFSKKPVIEEPKDPKDLQQIFHKMKTEGLINNAIKMFDALSKDGLTHEAMELFTVIKDKGNMPDVVAHTAVIEAYSNAPGHSKEALKVYMRMLASGVKPNAYTYTVLIKGLAKDGKFKDAKKYILEMMDKGMRPNVGTYTTVFEALVKEEKMEECEELVEQMKGKGFEADEVQVREHITSKRGHVFRRVMNLLFPSPK